MKRALCVASVLLIGAQLRADWSDLKPGMDANLARACVGMPLFGTNGRATQQWNFDHGGYILFERGRVIYWQQPTPPKLVQARPAEIAKKAPAAAKPGAAPSKKPSVLASAW